MYKLDAAFQTRPLASLYPRVATDQIKAPKIEKIPSAMSHSNDSSADAMHIWGTPRELTIPLDRSSLVQVELFGDTTKGWDASSPNNFHQVGQKLLQSEPWLLVAPHKTRIDGSITCIFKQTDAGRLNHLYSLAESLGLEMLGDAKPCRGKKIMPQQPNRQKCLIVLCLYCCSTFRIRRFPAGDIYR